MAATDLTHSTNMEGISLTMSGDLAYHGRGPPTMEGRPLSGCRLRVWQFGRRSVARIRLPTGVARPKPETVHRLSL